MRAHYFQHVPFEGLGSIEPWLDSNGYALTHTRFFESADLPAPETIDLLVVMGGPMSANDEDQYPWLVSEKRFVRNIIESGKPVLGICLGAQIIANAMGAKVSPNPVKEIGWYPIHALTPVNGSVFNFPPSQIVFHWHGETFDLPAGAIRLAKSEGCENQAFQLGARVIGLQFHLETTPQSARDIVTNCREELIPSRYVQTEKEILSAGSSRYKTINALMGRILSFLQRRLLIVDDTESNRQVLSKLLAPVGFDILEAQNGQEAIDVYMECFSQGFPPDFIWMDIRMPVLDGLEATQEIKRLARENAHDVIIIALSASTFDQDAEVFLSAGCDGFVKKPFNDHEIFEHMRQHLDLEYIYEDSTDEPETAIGDDVLFTRLKDLSMEWKKELKKAAEDLDHETMNSLVNQIRNQNGTLADLLQKEIDRFDYAKIIEHL